MTTITTLNQQLIYFTNTPTLRDQRNQTSHYTTLNTLPHSRSSSWTLHAQAKGFGSTSNTNTSMQKQGKTPKPGSTQGGGDDDDDDKIPQVVFDRMLRRILISVGVPLAMGVVTLKLLDLLKEQHVLDVPLWVPFFTSFVFFGSSVLGVPYGSLSTSWDAEKKGSLLGLDEVKYNWDEMWKEDEDKK